MITSISQVDIDYFWIKVDKSGKNGCWNWTWGTTKKGYGIFKLGDQSVYAHRLSYFMTNPAFDQSLCVLHKCDNPKCVNPEHLFLGNNTVNDNDKVSKDRQARGSMISTKLTEDDIVEMYKARLEGYSQKSLALKYRINQSQVSRILSGLRWRHMKPENLA